MLACLQIDARLLHRRRMYSLVLIVDYSGVLGALSRILADTYFQDRVSTVKRSNHDMLTLQQGMRRSSTASKE